MSRPPPQGPGAHRALPATDVLVGRIAWLIRLRWLAIIGTLLFVELAHRLLDRVRESQEERLHEAR